MVYDSIAFSCVCTCVRAYTRPLHALSRRHTPRCSHVCAAAGSGPAAAGAAGGACCPGVSTAPGAGTAGSRAALGGTPTPCFIRHAPAAQHKRLLFSASSGHFLVFGVACLASTRCSLVLIGISVIILAVEPPFSTAEAVCVPSLTLGHGAQLSVGSLVLLSQRQ